MNIKNQVRTSYPSNAKLIAHTDVVIDNWGDQVKTSWFQSGTSSSSDVILATDGNGHLILNNDKANLAERIIEDHAVSILPSVNSGTSSYTAEKCKKDLEFLNAKLDAVRKTITSWDAYNIKAVANNVDELDTLYNTATPNTGFLVNCISSAYDVAPGDIIFTDLNGQRSTIRARGSGYFYPSSFAPVKTIDGNEIKGTYQLLYKYATLPPNPGSAKLYDDNKDEYITLDTAAKEITTQIQFKDTIYAEKFTLEKDKPPQVLKVPALQGEATSHYPLCNVTTITGEKIWIDDSCYWDESDKQWKCYNPTNMSLHYEVR